MYMPNDLLLLNEEGVKAFDGKYKPDDTFLVSMSFDNDASFPAFFVVTNLRIFEEKTEPPQPLKLTLKKINLYFKPKLDEQGCWRTYFADSRRELTEQELREQHPKWLEKQNHYLKLIAPFITPENIWRYLSGELAADINAQADKENTYQQSLRVAMNRFLSMGSKIGLLPIKYANVGQGERIYKVKPGPKRNRRGEPVLSRSPVVTPEIKNQVKHTLLSNGIDKIEGKFRYTKAFTRYQKEFCSTSGYITKNGIDIPTLIVDEEKSINIQQFSRTARLVLSDIQRRTLKIGKNAFENNRNDKTGSAREGIFAGAHYCEIDSTPLPVYLAYPLDRKNRSSAGTVYMCLVGCVSTHLIVGMSISFSPPAWENVMEALLNGMQNKVEFAKQYGMEITEDEWPSQHLPRSIRVDNGPENPAQIIQKIIESNIGIKKSDWCPPGKGALKGTIENILKNIQEQIEQLPGTRDKNRDGSHQHASQKAILQKEDIIRLVIKAIITFNTTSARPKLLTREMEANDIKLTPSAMWEYLAQDKLHFRPKISQENLPQYFWKLLRKQKVKVTPREVVWEKMGYYSDWAKEERWFSNADHKGNYSEEMVSFGGLVDHLYFKDKNGDMQTFTLTKDYEKYRGMSLEQVYKLQRKRAEEIKQLEFDRNQAQVNMAQFITELTINGEKFYRNAPVNHQKSIQKGIKDRNAVMIADEQRQRAFAYSEILSVQKVSHNFNYIDQTTFDSEDYDPEDLS